ncbi:putative signal transducing protein [Pedobacter sp. SYSU D00535]|uniref:putative signal transducing protein n=1 Tax=Pedobacter sp. SYSU D00535 TaxID=2810308 RepID=UPI001A963332|nr:DUF2007 domain-containing protein [Pedobacter sp. SYSU D00535]
MNTEWIKVYSSNDFYKSELVRQVLVDHEIEAVLLDKQGYPYKVFGYVEVHVSPANAEKALEIINTNEL